MNLPNRIWAEMAWSDFENDDVESWIAVLPLAAVEQHGPHLPLSTDAEIMQGYLARVMSELPPDLPATFLPVQTIGLSPEHREFPGTLTLTAETALHTWTEIGESVSQTGVRKIVLVSSHGGNNGLMEIAARELRAEYGMLAVTASFARFGYPHGLFSAGEIAHGVHGGEIETSLMLAFRPDLVRTDRLDDFPAASQGMTREFKWLRAAKPAGFGWMAQDLNPDGALGNARTASAAKGQAAAEHGANAFIELLQDVHSFALDRLTEGPLGPA